MTSGGVPDGAGLVAAGRELGRVLDAAGAESGEVRDAVRVFVEAVTFAGAGDLRGMLRAVLAEDWSALPPWARALAYRLACLQCPGDPELLREAAADLRCFGPDWDAEAEDLVRRAVDLERQGPPSG
ncbi:hypothetical protein ABZ023_05825 [Streptomyces sp. NPDC006367]|uniref:hypothetical protein n=1 Tax=unclassified Streptomyces TaxID=2593676 RepID=UPI0033B8B244